MTLSIRLWSGFALLVLTEVAAITLTSYALWQTDFETLSKLGLIGLVVLLLQPILAHIASPLIAHLILWRYIPTT